MSTGEQSSSELNPLAAKILKPFAEVAIECPIPTRSYGVTRSLWHDLRTSNNSCKRVVIDRLGQQRLGKGSSYASFNAVDSTNLPKGGYNLLTGRILSASINMFTGNIADKSKA